MYSATGVGDEVPDRLPGLHPAADHRRGDRRSAASGRTRARSPPARPTERLLDPCSRAVPRRFATASVASDSTRSGSCQDGSPAATSPPTIRNSSLSGASGVQFLKGIDRVGRPGRARSRGPETVEPLVAVDRAAGTARAGARRPARPRPACAAGSGRDQHHSVEPELKVRLLRAHEVTEVRRVEGPAEDADAHGEISRRRGSRADVARALDQVLERAQLAQADRAAGVELLGRVADLGAHPELAAVGEPGRGVDVHAGGVDAELERARGGGVAR